MAAGIYGLMRGGEFVQTNDNQLEDSLLNVGQFKVWFYQSGNSLKETQIITMKDRMLTAPFSYPDAITISLKCAKNDPKKAGTEVRICDPLGIRMIINYLLLSHPSLGDKESGLFINQNGSRFTSARLVSNMQEYLSQANIPDPRSYTLHSLRKGGAQSLRDLGDSEEHIQLAGRWNSESAARLYSRQSLSEYIQASRRISSLSSK